MKTATGFLLATILLSGTGLAGEKVPATENEKTNYSVGYQIGGDFRKQGVEIDPESMVQGILDGSKDTAPKISPQAMQKMLSILKSKITAAEQQRKNAQYETDRKEGQAFLAKNAKEEGVVTLSNGVQYKVVKEGSGKSPGPLDNVSIHYVGMLTNGSEFYSTRKGGKPSDTLVGNLIPGMREVVQKMTPGSRWQAFIPPEMGYAGGTPLYGKTVILDIELLKVHKTE